MSVGSSIFKMCESHKEYIKYSHTSNNFMVRAVFSSYLSSEESGIDVPAVLNAN
jgi:hypothetical protein